MGELELLYQALASPLGIVIRVDNFQLAQAKLYAARRQSGDPELACLQLRHSPFDPEQELWIIRGQPSHTPSQE